MIDPKNVFYLETGEDPTIIVECSDRFHSAEFSSTSYSHWLEDKYRQLIDLQTKNHV